RKNVAAFEVQMHQHWVQKAWGAGRWKVDAWPHSLDGARHGLEFRSRLASGDLCVFLRRVVITDRVPGGARKLAAENRSRPFVLHDPGKLIKQFAIIEVQERLATESEQYGRVSIQPGVFQVQSHLAARNEHSLPVPTGDQLLWAKSVNGGSQSSSLKAGHNEGQIGAIETAKETKIKMILMFMTYVYEALFLWIRQFIKYQRRQVVIPRKLEPSRIKSPFRGEPGVHDHRDVWSLNAIAGVP